MPMTQHRRYNRLALVRWATTELEGWQSNQQNIIVLIAWQILTNIDIDNNDLVTNRRCQGLYICLILACVVLRSVCE